LEFDGSINIIFSFRFFHVILMESLIKAFSLQDTVRKSSRKSPKGVLPTTMEKKTNSKSGGFSGQLGFVLAAAGSAVGVGNGAFHTLPPRMAEDYSF
jgi:hypothetical protein